MNTKQQTVQYGLMCLELLGGEAAAALSVQEISQRQGIPLARCAGVLARLAQAGLIRETTAHTFELARSVEELTAHDVLQALWQEPAKTTAFQLLYGIRETVRLTVTAARGMTLEIAQG